MLVRELYEAEKAATLAFGRMNPPTIGHKKLVDVVASQQGDPFLFITQTQTQKMAFAYPTLFSLRHPPKKSKHKMMLGFVQLSPWFHPEEQTKKMMLGCLLLFSSLTIPRGKILSIILVFPPASLNQIPRKNSAG